jgi:hypothetical protein
MLQTYQSCNHVWLFLSQTKSQQLPQTKSNKTSSQGSKELKLNAVLIFKKVTVRIQDLELKK